MRNNIKLLERKNYLGNNQIVVEKRKIDVEYFAHLHDFFEIEFIVRGTAQVALNGKSYEAAAGDIYFLTPEDIHSVTKCDNLELFNMVFCEEYLPEDLSFEQLLSIKGRLISLKSENNQKAEQLFEQIVFESQNKECIHNTLYIQSLLKCIFIILMRSCNTVEENHINNMQGVLLYLQRHFKEDIKLEDAAKYAHLNHSYFCNLFRKTTGMGFNHYLNNLRINFAKKMLKTTSATITEICYLSGFQSFSTFSRKFKANSGVSPSDYRTEIFKI